VICKLFAAGFSNTFFGMILARDGVEPPTPPFPAALDHPPELPGHMYSLVYALEVRRACSFVGWKHAAESCKLRLERPKCGLEAVAERVKVFTL